MDSYVTILEPAADPNIVTLDMVVSEFGLGDLSVAETEKWLRWIKQESVTIAQYTKRSWTQETVEQVFDLTPPYDHHVGWSTLELRWKRLAEGAVTEVMLGDTVLDPAEWFVDLRYAQLRRVANANTGGGVWGGPGNPPYRNWLGGLLRATFVRNYVAGDTMPADVESACLKQLKHRQSSTNRDSSIRSETVGPFTTQYWVAAPNSENAALVPEAIDLLRSHIERFS